MACALAAEPLAAGGEPLPAPRAEMICAKASSTILVGEAFLAEPVAEVAVAAAAPAAEVEEGDEYIDEMSEGSC